MANYIQPSWDQNASHTPTVSQVRIGVLPIVNTADFACLRQQDAQYACEIWSIRLSLACPCGADFMWAISILASNELLHSVPDSQYWNQFQAAYSGRAILFDEVAQNHYCRVMPPYQGVTVYCRECSTGPLATLTLVDMAHE